MGSLFLRFRRIPLHSTSVIHDVKNTVKKEVKKEVKNNVTKEVKKDVKPEFEMSVINKTFFNNVSKMYFCLSAVHALSEFCSVADKLRIETNVKEMSK